MKVYLELEAMEDMPQAGWKKGDVLKQTFNMFDRSNGLAFNPLDKRWKVLKAELREYKPINNK